jgi:hypothetical protein
LALQPYGYADTSILQASGEVASWLNFARTAGGFIISYFQVNPHLSAFKSIMLMDACRQVTWANTKGTEQSMGVQAAICAAGLGLIIVLQIFGKRLRIWSGPSHFKTN